MLLPVVVAAVAACATVLGIEDRPLRPDATSDAGDAGPADPCAHVRPPPRPERDDAPDSIPPFYLAMRTLNFLGNESAFDLDGVCTCDTRPGTAADGGPSCVGPTAACDLEGGADNRADTFFSGYSDLVDIDQLSAVSTAAAEGARTILLHIAEYNGTANDREVLIGIMHSRGILDGSGCGTVATGAGSDAGAAKAPAGWCGHDKWTYPGALVVPASKVPLLRVKGWVTNGRLVFDTDVPISILVGESTVAFGSPKGAGHLEKGADGMWRLSDGVLAGRIPMTDLLAAIGMLPGTKDDAGRKPLCEVNVFENFKTTLCSQPDIRSTSASDFQPGACDAMSAAMRLTAEQADVGEEYTPPAEDNPCAPDRVDAGLYACP